MTLAFFVKLVALVIQCACLAFTAMCLGEAEATYNPTNPAGDRHVRHTMLGYCAVIIVTIVFVAFWQVV